MCRIWIYIFTAILGIIGGACSDDVSTAHDDYSSSEESAIRVLTSSSEHPNIPFSRSKITALSFSNIIGGIISSSSVKNSSSSKKAKSSSSSKPAPVSSAISSSIESSSSISSSSVNAPKSSSSLTFYDCDTYKCVTLSYLNPEASYGELLDKRDGKVYRTIVVSNHVWTAQNMNFETEDDSIAQSWCFSNMSVYCQTFGRLYDWYAAQKACPEGWHLPTVDEWAELLGDHACDQAADVDSLGFLCAGAELKSTKTWNDDPGNQNTYGFSVISTGIRYNDEFMNNGKYALFWSVTDTLDQYANAVLFDTDDDAYIGLIEKESGFSVRCVKGEAE